MGNYMKTISKFLLNCKIGDKFEDSNTGFCWTVSDDFIENGKRIVVATPDENNSDRFELWSTGLESYVVMNGLNKINPKR